MKGDFRHGSSLGGSHIQKTALSLLAVYFAFIFLAVGCSPSQSGLSEGNLVTELADAIAEEIRGLNSKNNILYSFPPN